MATITITVSAGAQTYTHTKTLTAAHLTRMVAAYRGIYGQVPNGSGGMRDMTDTEVVAKWATGLFNGTAANVKSYEQDAASRAAAVGVTDITLS